MATSRHGRDHILGLAPRDPFSGGAVAPPPGSLPQWKSSAVDFSDVFGGPPRRASLYEPRRGVGEPAESGAFVGTGGGGDVGERSRRWSSSVVDKPVFGGVGSPAHRRHLGDNFFSDIFRGNSESACPTPRKDVFVSTPGSRFLSPARPLPPTGDVLGGSFSLPAHSYSTRLAKTYDYLSFRSPAAYAVCKNEEMIPDVFSVPASPNVYAATNSNPLIRMKDGLKGSKAYGGSGHFHFSIYKWASKGMTLIMPSSFKERTKSGSRLSEVSPQVLQQAELPPDHKDLPHKTQPLQNLGEIDDKSPSPSNDLALAGNDSVGLSNEVTKLFPAASDIKLALRDVTDKSDDVRTCIKDSTGFPQESGKLFDESDREDITRQAKNEESLVSDCKTVMKGADGTATVKQENGKHTILHYTENASKEMKQKMVASRPRGKVKEFIKAFNEETGHRTNGTREVWVSRRKVKDEIKGKVEGHTNASAHVANAQEDIGNHVEPPATPIAIGQNLKKAEQTTSVRSSDAQKIDDPFSEINDTSVASFESTVDGLDASFFHIDEAHFESIGEHMVEELSQDRNEVTEANLLQEVQVETSDTRIQQWSKGKEGNIRSLLSTLQYVLWPGSGWKSVPLVDIIEGASVRRAYQKALLCLHPDKLQQKGAEMHQKYIAEKIFDILQEAWTRFDSPSSL